MVIPALHMRCRLNVLAYAADGVYYVCRSGTSDTQLNISYVIADNVAIYCKKRILMTVGQKAAVSLLVSTLLAAGFAAIAWSGLFSVIETRFFDQRVKRSVDISMDGLSASVEAYHETSIARFQALLEKDYVRRSFLPNQSAEDVFERTKSFGLLTEETAGLLGVRFIDQDGKRIHYSTFPADTLRSDSLKVVYRNYGEDDDGSFTALSVAEGSGGTVATLPAKRSFAYRFPFIDGFGVYRGSAIFYLSFSGLLERLVQDQRLSLGDDLVAVGYDGILVGVPAWAGDEFIARVGDIWVSGPNAEPVTVGATESSGSYVLFSKRGSFGLLGRLVPSTWFEMPEALRWLMLAAFFITIYLSLFLVLNLRQDRLSVLAARIKRFQIELLEEYLDRKGDMDIDRWKVELEARRGEAKTRIRKSAGGLARKRPADVDALIDKSWDEIIAVMTSRGERPGGTDFVRFEALLKEALSKGSFIIGSSQASHAGTALPSDNVASITMQKSVKPASVEAVAATKDIEEPEAVEELEELEAEAVEELEELEETEVEALEVQEAPEPEAVEEFEELEELEAEAEEEEKLEETEVEALEVQEAPEPEAVEEFEELEELEAEAVEELEEAEA